MDIDKLIQEIYRFYPRNCDPFTEAFDLATETKNRGIAIKERRLLVHSGWTELVDELQKKFPGSTISDDSAAFDREFCNYCSFYRTIDNVHFKFHVLLSLLAPLHTVLVSLFSGTHQQHLLTCDHEEVPARLREQGMHVVSIERETSYINGQLIRLFDTRAIKKSALDAIPVQDIATQSWPKGNVPLFDLVFTDHLLIF